MLQCEVIGNIGSDAEIKEFNGKKVRVFQCRTFRETERFKRYNGGINNMGFCVMVR